MKLIKIKDDHYVIVDDSEVRPNNFVYSYVTNKIVKFTDPRHFSDNTYKKITHSTQPIEKEYSSSEDGGRGYFVYDKIQELSLQEVKELIGEVDVFEKAKEEYPSIIGTTQTGVGYDMNGREKEAYKKGYNQALEDNKDKKYTEEDMFNCFNAGVDCEFGGSPSFDIWIKSLQPKTEWEVEIVDGKLKLK